MQRLVKPRQYVVVMKSVRGNMMVKVVQVRRRQKYSLGLGLGLGVVVVVMKSVRGSMVFFCFFLGAGRHGRWWEGGVGSCQDSSHSPHNLRPHPTLTLHPAQVNSSGTGTRSMTGGNSSGGGDEEPDIISEASPFGEYVIPTSPSANPGKKWRSRDEDGVW